MRSAPPRLPRLQADMPLLEYSDAPDRRTDLAAPNLLVPALAQACSMTQQSHFF